MEYTNGAGLSMGGDLWEGFMVSPHGTQLPCAHHGFSCITGWLRCIIGPHGGQSAWKQEWDFSGAVRQLVAT